MIVLAADTSTPFLSVALCEDDGVLAEYNEPADRRHAELILGVVDDLFRRSGLELKNVDLLAVTRGPGSFTGLRVGISTWKGLASGAALPLIGVSTLDALARRCAEPRERLCVLLDAKMQEVYGATYEFRDGKLRKTQEDSVGPVAEFVDADAGSTAYMGDGALLYAETIREAHPDAVVLSEEESMPRASAVAAVGLECFRQGDPSIASEVVPVYLRQSQAERNRAKAQAESV
jgi:tRNA threonylcarbamoyladenosine biosynthesis protein TsaB